MGRSLIFLLLAIISINAQEVIYKPIFINQCKNSIDSTTSFSIEKNGKYFKYENSFMNSVILPDTGIYSLIIDFKNDESYEIEVTKFGNVSDTFYLPKIKLEHTISNPPSSEYYYCDSVCDGTVIDYYYSGNIRMKGTFRNGWPIDTLKEYHPNGKLKSIFYEFKESHKVYSWDFNYFLGITYDKYGNVVSHINTKENFERKYYSSGKLLSEEHFDMREEIEKNESYRYDYTEYYENGLMKLQIDDDVKEEYFENGKLKLRMEKYEPLLNKLIRWFSEYDDKYLICDFKEYDLTGLLIREGQIEIGNSEYILSHGFPDDLTKASQEVYNKK